LLAPITTAGTQLVLTESENYATLTSRLPFPLLSYTLLGSLFAVHEGLALARATNEMSELSASYVKLIESESSSVQSQSAHASTGELALEQERAMVLRLLDGDTAAFDELYQRYVPGLFRFIYYSLNGDRNDAEDVLQETMLAAIRSLSRFRSDSSLSTWLHVIARNKISDQIRRRQRFRNHQVEEEAADLELQMVSMLPEDMIAQRSDIEAVLRALPQDQRDVLLGKYLDGFSVRELSSIMGRSEKAVESLLTRAREAFRTCLESLTSEGS
jgi:RNA polymerase sigma-70 factor (ECF subfamily)